jgi:hypothetical protein
MRSEEIALIPPEKQHPHRLGSCIAIAMGVFFTLTSVVAAAEGDTRDEEKSASEPRSAKSLWINPGLYSIHFQDKDFNDNNRGFGVEYRYTDTLSVTAGVFKNSDWENSRYLSAYWQPFSLGPIKLGATIGALDGYPSYRDGAWFLAAIPAATYEGKQFGLNVLLAPNYKDKIHGAISFQVKFRVW